MTLRLAAPSISASLLSLLVLFTPLPRAAVVLQYHHVSEETLRAFRRFIKR